MTIILQYGIFNLTCKYFRLGVISPVVSKLPEDPVILLSCINTLLRDEFPTFDELCAYFCTEKQDIEEKLNSIGYTYDSGRNCFV